MVLYLPDIISHQDPTLWELNYTSKKTGNLEKLTYVLTINIAQLANVSKYHRRKVQERTREEIQMIPRGISCKIILSDSASNLIKQDPDGLELDTLILYKVTNVSKKDGEHIKKLYIICQTLEERDVISEEFIPLGINEEREFKRMKSAPIITQSIVDILQNIE